MIKKVVIIEDDPASIAILRRYLTLGEIDSVACTSLAPAEQVIREYKPDVIFLDLTMAQSDGVDFLKVREGDFKLRQIPVIVISANAKIQKIAECFKNGADSYLIKPVMKSLLFPELEKYGVVILS